MAQPVVEFLSTRSGRLGPLLAWACISMQLAPGQTVYTIGNSLTQDTRPQFLPDAEWHIYCAKNLQFIYDNPAGHCATSSRPWDDALVNSTYDYVVVQPHYGTTLEQDAAVIGSWIDLQPATTTWVVHSGWPGHANLVSTYDGPWNGVSMTHHEDYFDALIDSLATSHPGIEVIFNPAVTLLRSIAEDIALGTSPYGQLSDLYRDDIHISFTDGRYLQHNLLRTTLGLPIDANLFPAVSTENAAYLNSKMASIRAPTDVWAAVDNGAWSVDANWVDGIAPTPGGGDDQVLKFEYAGEAPLPTFTNDLAGVFTIHSLILNSPGSEGFVLDGNPLKFVPSAAGAPMITAVGVSPVAMHFDLEIDDVTTLAGAGPDVTVAGVVSGPGGLVVDRPASRTTLTAETTYAGATTVRGGDLVVEGSVVASAAIAVEHGGRLELEYESPVDKIGDATDVALEFAALVAHNLDAAAIQEDVGSLTLRADSANTIRLAGESAPVVLSAASLERESGAVLLVEGGPFGDADVDQLRFVTPPTLLGGDGAEGSASRSIVPLVVGDQRELGESVRASVGLVTYDENVGVTLLDEQTEYAPDVVSGVTSTDNVRLTTAINNIDAPTAVNALFLDVGGSLAGGGTLAVTSGNVLANDAAAAIDVATLELTASEAMIWTAEDLTITADLAASVDLVKAGPKTLTLTGATTVPGEASVLAGTMVVAGGSLDAETLLVRGTGAQFSAGAGIVAVNAAHVAHGGRIDLMAGQSLTVAGTTTVESGGTVLLDGGVLTTSNLHEQGGDFIFASGELHFSSPLLAIAPAGPLGSNVVLGSSQTLSVAGTTTISQKGALYLEGGTFITGQLVLDSPDAILVASSGALQVDELVATAGATLAVENDQSIDIQGSLRIDTNSSLLLAGGMLSVSQINNNGGTVDFTSGVLQLTGADWTVGAAGLLGTEVTLNEDQALTVSGATTLESAATLTVDGGSLTTSEIVSQGGAFDFRAGAVHLTSSDLEIDAGGLLGVDVTLGDGQRLTVDGVVTVRSAGSLTMASGELTADALVLDGPTAAFTLYGPSPQVSGFSLLRGAQHQLTIGQQLLVGGETHIGVGSHLHLAGGTLVTDALSIDGGLTFESGRLELTGQSLNVAAGELFGPVLTLRQGQTLSVSQNVDVDASGVVRLESGSWLDAGQFTNHGVLELEGSTATLAASSVSNLRTLGGTGRILADLTNQALGEIRVQNSERLTIQGAAHVNAGAIEVLAGEISFAGVLTNEAGGGAIQARDARLRFNDGLINDGAVNLSFGVADVFGDVTNGESGTIVVAGSSQATFFDDLENQGEVRTSAGSTTVFFGTVTGGGTFTGTGTTAFEGAFLPGNSPAQVTLAGDVLFGPAAQLEVEVGGTAAGHEFDMLAIDGAMVADGTLLVDWIELEGAAYQPQQGDSLTIITAAGGLTGQFVADLPALPVGLRWVLDYLPTSLVLRIEDALVADFDGSGAVDGDDLRNWEAHFGTSLDFSSQHGASLQDGDADLDNDVDGHDFVLWQREAGQVAAAATGIPEPSAATLLVMLASAWLARRRLHRSGA